MTCANHPDRDRKAFCQNCGKPLCAECARVVGQAVFCEPCLEQRLAAANAAANPLGSAAAPPFAGPSASAYGATTPQDASFGQSAAPPPPPPAGAGPTPPPPTGFAGTVAGTPNPGLAFLLGFIPGVGAMYNGQYAKGVVHLVIFAVLVSLSDQNGLFGLFVAGWVFYQAMEAHHTARARRDGVPLPNPFGLNDIGERLGFGRSWPTAAAPPPPPSDPYRAAANPYSAAATPPFTPPQEAASWGAATETYAPPVPPVTPVSPVESAPVPRATSAFPYGAVALIGLGVLFLIGNTRWLGRFSIQFLLPFLLMGLAVWLFFRRMTTSGTGLADDGTPFYRLRLIRALQGSVWLLLVGVLFLLDNLHILTWGHSWPLFIIVGGALALIQRSAYTALPSAPPAYPAPQPPPQTYTATPQKDPETALIPRDRQEL